MFERTLQYFNPVDRSSSLWPLARRYAWTLPAVAGLGFLSSLLEGVGISLLIPLLGTLMQSTGLNLPGPLAPFYALLERIEPATRLLVISGTIFGFVIAKVIVQGANQTLIAWIDGHVSHEIRIGIAGRLLDVGYPFFLSTGFARLLNIISVDSWRASEAIRLAYNIVASAAACVVFLGLLLWLNWQLTLVVAAGSLLIRGVHFLFMRRAAALSVAVTDTNTLLGDLMLHCIQGMRLIRVFGQQALEHKKFSAASVEVDRTMFAVARLTAWAGGFNEAANSALFIGILLGAFFAGVPLPALAAFLILLFRFQPFLRALSTARLGLASTQASVDGVEWLLSPAGKPAAPAGLLPFGGVVPAIVFEVVDFAYEGDRGAVPALQQASFRIGRGRITALIGLSGAGKSTVVNLLCRLLEPTAGRILVGDMQLNTIEPASWRACIGYAGQDADLLDGSVADNIRYGKPEATAAEVEAAAQLAQIHPFIAGLPRGYDTAVGAHGTALSGGQRQRIGLARALVRRPALLILDEATNAIDAVSEATILARVAACPWQPTVLVISHRVAAVSACQDGIVLEHGRVVDSGPLEGLAAYHAMTRHAA